MRKKSKRFDCVEMKRKAQEALRAEFESRKDEFESYFDFLEWKADQSTVAKKVRQKIAADAASHKDS